MQYTVREKSLLYKKFLPFVKNLCKKINDYLSGSNLEVEPLNIFYEDEFLEIQDNHIIFNLDSSKNLSYSVNEEDELLRQAVSFVIYNQNLGNYIETGNTKVKNGFIELHLYKDISTNILKRIKDKV